MRNTILMATLMVIDLIATACGGGQAAAPKNPPAQSKEQPMSSKDTLSGTSWTLTTLNGQPALKDTTVTLNFVAGKVADSDGCNNYNGSYTADGTTIKFNQPMAATMMACPDPIMKQATAYMQALGQAATYRADAKQLTLSDSSGKELATFSAQSSDLSGTSWMVTGYSNGKQAVVSVMAGTELTENLGADGHNEKSVRASRDGSRDTISDRIVHGGDVSHRRIEIGTAHGGWRVGGQLPEGQPMILR